MLAGVFRHSPEVECPIESYQRHLCSGVEDVPDISTVSSATQQSFTHASGLISRSDHADGPPIVNAGGNQNST